MGNQPSNIQMCCQSFIMASVVALLLLPACENRLETSDIERLVRARLTDRIKHVCLWRGPQGLKWIDKQRGRYLFGSTRLEREPESCLEQLKKAGVIKGFSGVDFFLSDRAWFVPFEEGEEPNHVSVAYECGTVTISRIGSPFGPRENPRAQVVFRRSSEAPFVAELKGPNVRCMGGVYPANSFCDVLFVRREEGWSIAGCEGLACRNLRL